jgi:hypothetical protein
MLDVPSTGAIMHSHPFTHTVVISCRAADFVFPCNEQLAIDVPSVDLQALASACTFVLREPIAAKDLSVTYCDTSNVRTRAFAEVHFDHEQCAPLAYITLGSRVIRVLQAL